MISNGNHMVRDGLIWIAFLLGTLLLVGMTTNLARAQDARTRARTAFNGAAAIEQPLYSEYKGVRLGMTADEVRLKLGPPALKGEDQDYYVFSPKETAQIAYDGAHKVTAISVDYVDGSGAPDPKAVVGGELEVKNGSAYRIVRYESLGFWVSYNRSAGPMVVVSITIQRVQKQ